MAKYNYCSSGQTGTPSFSWVIKDFKFLSSPLKNAADTQHLNLVYIDCFFYLDAHQISHMNRLNAKTCQIIFSKIHP